MKAMLLAAGYGTRLGNLTQEVPKPMLAIEGYPLLAYLISNLARNGFDEIMINVHFLADVIRDYLKDGADFNVRLSYVHEQTLLGTAGAVKNVASFFNNEENFLVHYGDILTDQDFAGLLDAHRQKQALATLLLHRRENSNSIVGLDDERRITAFLERPDETERKRIDSRWVNSGVYLCSAEILDHIPQGKVVDFPRDVFAHLCDGGRLFGYPLTGYRCAVDSQQRLDEARLAVRQGRCRVHIPKCVGKII